MRTPLVQQPRFQGLKPGALLASMPPLQRRLAQVVNFNEVRAAGLSTEKFAQATIACLIPKLILSRSKNETAEIVLQELIESAFFYYSIPVAATFLFHPAFKALTPKANQLPAAALKKTFSQILPKEMSKLLPLKTGLILASLSMIPLTFSINYVKNLMTEKFFRRERFSDIVNLSQGHLKDGEVSPTAKKSIKRIKQCFGIAAGMIAAGAGIAAYGHKIPQLQPLFKNMVKFLDLKYDGKLFGASLTHLIAWWWINPISYVDSARDRLEKVEVGIRTLGVTAPFLYPIAYLLRGSFISHFGQKTPMLLKPFKPENSIENNVVKRLFGEKTLRFMNLGDGVKTLKELERDCLEQAKKQVEKLNPGVINTQLVKQEAQKMMTSLVRAKNFLYWVPFSISVLGTGLFVGLLNRHYTAVRYQRAQNAEKAKQAQAFKMPQVFIPTTYNSLYPMGLADAEHRYQH